MNISIPRTTTLDQRTDLATFRNTASVRTSPTIQNPCLQSSEKSVPNCRAGEEHCCASPAWVDEKAGTLPRLNLDARSHLDSGQLGQRPSQYQLLVLPCQLPVTPFLAKLVGHVEVYEPVHNPGQVHGWPFTHQNQLVRAGNLN